MSLISVIIPVYNGADTIEETIQSVFNQTFSDFELIVINDGSKDSTLDILSQINDSRLKVFSYANAGQPASRNRGISQATGDYISFLDADDLWCADKLEMQFQALQDNPQAAVAYSWTDWIDQSGNVFRKGPHFNYSGDVLSRLFLNDFIGSGSNPLIRKQASLDVGKFDESLSNAHDWDMWLRLAARYPFVAVPSVHILYRISANSMSFNIWGMEASSLRVIDKAVTNAPDSLQTLKPISLGNRYKYLTGKALEGRLERSRSWAASQFLWQAIRHDPSLLRGRVLMKVMMKIILGAMLPPQTAQVLVRKLGKLADIQALYGYMKFEPS